MRIQSFNQTVIDCEEVLNTLSVGRIQDAIECCSSFVKLDCCNDCVKLDPKHFHRHEHWRFGVNTDYHRQTQIVRTSIDGKRQYPFPLVVVTCCHHIHLIRNLEEQDWNFLKEKLHDPYYSSDPYNKGTKKKTPKRAREAVRSCEFCSRELELDETKCPTCFP